MAASNESPSPRERFPEAWQLEFDDNSDRYGHILEGELFTDCSFLVGSEQPVEVKAHKLLLAMSSPVFEAMFYGGMAEQTFPIRIPDMEPDVFKTMLKFMYKNDVTLKEDQFAVDLFYGAQKYMLPLLVAECVCPVYEIALKDGVRDLIEQCEEIIKTQTEKVLATKSFLNLSIETVTKIFSFERLNISSELVLVNAAARFDLALKARSAKANVTQIADGDTTSEAAAATTAAENPS